MDDFTKGYIDTMLAGASIDSLSPETLDFVLGECLTFSHNNKEFLL